MELKKKRIFFLAIITLILSITVVNAEIVDLTHVPIKPGPSIKITSGYGWRTHPIQGGQDFHSGIDIGAPMGTYIYSFMDGEVIMAKRNGSAGNEIRIKHKNNLETRYYHMDKRAVNVGDNVRAGRIIGTVGSTGNSTGPHLHFEVRKNGAAINPTTVNTVKEGE